VHCTRSSPCEFTFIHALGVQFAIKVSLSWHFISFCSCLTKVDESILSKSHESYHFPSFSLQFETPRSLHITPQSLATDLRVNYKRKFHSVLLLILIPKVWICHVLDRSSKRRPSDLTLFLPLVRGRGTKGARNCVYHNAIQPPPAPTPQNSSFSQCDTSIRSIHQSHAPLSRYSIAPWTLPPLLRNADTFRSNSKNPISFSCLS
jgi:hypothetical protein